MYRSIGKRAIDFVVACISICVLSPLLIVLAAWIAIDSPGSPLFLQRRVGLNGRPFQIYKFRTMLRFQDSYDSTGNELPNEKRITTPGRFLRRFSLDELPQLINVVRGEMSIIGPRPTLAYQVNRYTERQRMRLDVRPGITGLAQVSGRNSLTWEEKINFDLTYVDNLSFRQDLQIILKTIRVVVRGEDTTFQAHDGISQHGGKVLKHVGLEDEEKL